jgi:hypothetical protein
MSKRTIRFVLGTIPYSVTVATRLESNNAPYQTTTLAPPPESFTALTLSASYPGGCGQCDEIMREAAEQLGCYDGALKALLTIWARWHLNEACAGTDRQTQALIDATGNARVEYAQAQAILATAGLLTDRGHQYGGGWLLDVIPDAVLTELSEALNALDGARLPPIEILTVDEAEDILTGLEDIEGADVIDGRDLSERLEGLRNYLTARGVDLDDLESAADTAAEANDSALLDVIEETTMLADIADTYAVAIDNGETFIAATYFEDYAQNYAAEVSLINENASWPNNHIDWTAAAEELKIDYTEATLYGEAYLVRSN